MTNDLPPLTSNPAKTSHIRGLIVDMDGVLWRGTEPVGDLPAIFRRIREHGWRIVLATNNATRTPEQYQEKLLSYGVDLSPNEIINSAIATARYLSRRFPQGGPVYIVGEEGLVEALSAAGFYACMQDPVAVVVGMDRQFTYEKMRVANQLIRNGALFIATNTDKTFPTPDGLVPGAGAVIAGIETAAGVSPMVIGKPSTEMYRVSLDLLHTSPAETLAIGDRLETDIAGGQALGCLTALVLSGVTSIEQAKAWQPKPDWIAKDLAELLSMID
ncbi:MAG: HAD-IIA family hydrolase [Omnitrophica WOR_2 bacterium]